MMNGDPSAARRPPPPIPLTIVTGFLGAGKTTLLNHLLVAPELADTLVLINEFGDVGLDHLFIEKIDGDMVLMSSGCVCCTIRGDLVNTLEDLLRKLDNGRIKPFRRVILETTGLADPAPILHAIMHHPYLLLRFRLDGVVTVIDAVNADATLDAQEEAVKQAAVADRLVMTKTDLPEGAGRVAGLTGRLTALNPGARILNATNGEATPAAVLDCGLFDPETKTPRVREWLNAEAIATSQDHADRHHAHDPRHAHDPNRHDAHIRAFCLTGDKPFAPSSFEAFIELLRGTHGPRLLRVKGIVALADDESRPVVIHGVQHVFHPPQRLDAWPDDDHRTRIVFILKDLDARFIESLYASLVDWPGIGQADAAAITRNPLTPKAGGLLG